MQHIRCKIRCQMVRCRSTVSDAVPDGQMPCQISDVVSDAGRDDQMQCQMQCQISDAVSDALFSYAV